MPTRIFDIALAEAWAIDASKDAEGRPYAKLRQILEIAAREEQAEDLEALQVKLARPLPPAERAGERDGVAIIPIIGPTFPRANLMTRISGATSLQMVGRDLQVALDDRRINGVILDIDSPGGVVTGTNELAKFIARAQADAGKPIVAYVGGGGTSAAFWFGSAVGLGHFMVDETAQVGSIGVVLTMLDTSRRDQARGIQEFTFVSSQSPSKRVDPRTDAGAAVLQAKADKTAEIFIEAVAGHRQVTVDRVLEDFGQGDTVLGRDAVGAGMADAATSFEEVLSAVSRGEFGSSTSRTFSPAREERAMTIKTAADLVAAYPALAGEIKAEGRTEGLEQGRTEGREAAEKTAEAGQEKAVAEARADAAKAATEAERKRIGDLEAASLPGFEKQLKAAIADGSTAADLALKTITAQREQGGDYLAKLEADRKALAAGGLPANKSTEDGTETGKSAPKVDARAHKRAIEDVIAAERAKGRTIDAAEADAIVTNGQA